MPSVPKFDQSFDIKMRVKVVEVLHTCFLFVLPELQQALIGTELGSQRDEAFLQFKIDTMSRLIRKCHGYVLYIHICTVCKARVSIQPSLRLPGNTWTIYVVYV